MQVDNRRQRRSCAASVVAAVWLAAAIGGAGQAAAQQGGRELAIKGIATGFVVDDRGSIVTAAHEVDGCPSLAVLAASGGPQPVSRVVFDRAGDLALITSVASTSLRPLAIGDGEAIALGDPIYILGFPLQRILQLQHPTFMASLVAGFGGPNGDSEVFRLPFAILPGASGAAALNAQGQVVGVVRSHVIQTAPNGNITIGGETYVTKGQRLVTFLRDQGLKVVGEDNPKTLSQRDIAERAVHASVIVLCNE